MQNDLGQQIGEVSCRLDATGRRSRLVWVAVGLAWFLVGNRALRRWGAASRPR